MIIAIDGPVGVGKSSVARLVAKRLGLLHIDTGAMYRALAWACLEEDLDPENSAMMGDLAKRTHIELDQAPHGLRVLCNSCDISQAIRTPEVTAIVSPVSAHPELRQIVVDQQRRMASGRSVVMEGRDIGTVVFPNADLKIFLEASVDARVRRRARDYEAAGIPWSHEELRQTIQQRDDYDSSRAHSPLTKTPDMVAIDTTPMTLDEVVEKILSLAHKAIRR